MHCQSHCPFEFLPPAQVSGRDDITKLAGRIAWNARRDENVPLLASGQAAIYTAVQGITNARKYLGQDRDPLELICQPAYRSESKTASLAFYFSTLNTRKKDIYAKDKVK